MKEWLMIHKIKALYDEGRGMSIRGIARELGISRNTVRKYLEMDEEIISLQQECRARRKRLDAHRDYLVSLLEQFPCISAVKLLRKLKEREPDLSVSDRSARCYIRQLKERVTLKQKRYYEPVIESVPGVQCQLDCGELRGVEVGGVETTAYFKVFVLSCSRLMFVDVSQHPVNTESFIRMHDAAFRYLGGRPEECVYDQTRLVVINEQYRELVLNQAVAAYATAAGFRIHACEGYDPESKGKVEAGVKYVKGNGLAGEVFEDWEELRLHIQQWLDEVATPRCHGTTGEAPLERFERDEKQQLAPYFTPSSLGIPSSEETRKVDKTGLISWQANKYSVPMAYQGARVGVRSEDGRLVLFDLKNGNEIACHRLTYGKGEVVRNNDHYRDKAARITDLETKVKAAAGPLYGEQLCKLLRQTSPRIYKDQFSAMVRLLNRYDDLPEYLFKRLCDRPSLTATQCRDLLDAYAFDPARFMPSEPEKQSGTKVLDGLDAYASLTVAREVSNGYVH